MRPNTENFPTGVKPKISAALATSNSTTTGIYVSLYDEDFVAESLTFRESTSESGEITVGAAMITSCSFTLWNNNGKLDNLNWTNSSITIWLQAYDEDGEYQQASMGTFFIVSHTVNGKTIKVEAYDPIKIMDEHRLGEVGITWPIDAVDAITAIANYDMRDFTSIDIQGLSSSRGITLKDPGNNDMSNRDAISYIAQCLGKYVLMTASPVNTTRSMIMLFDWYKTSTAYDVGMTFNHSLRTDDVHVTGVTVTAYEQDNDGNDITVTKGTDGYKINIFDNPFITSDNLNAVATRINSAVNGLTFRPGNFAVTTAAKIRAGDAIKIDTPEEKGVITLATNVTYKPTSVKENISAEADAVTGDLQVNLKSYINRTAKTTAESVAGGGGSGGVSFALQSGMFQKDSSVSGSYDRASVSGDYVYAKDSTGKFFLHGEVKITIEAANLDSIPAGSYVYIKFSDPPFEVGNTLTEPTYRYLTALMRTPMTYGAYTPSAVPDVRVMYNQGATNFQVYFSTAVTVTKNAKPMIYIPFDLIGYGTV